MPRQNRVTPFGEIVAVPERGTMMGNRGVVHDAAGTIRRPWQLKRWILCLTEFKGRQRTVMSPGRWTELFFLDEATGLAAGHRPCAECRRVHFRAFQSAWAAGNPGTAADRVPEAGAIDEQLHAERVGPGRAKVRFAADLDELPDGVFVTLDEKDDGPAYLFWRGALFAWSPGGYGARRPRPAGARVSVLTPASTVAAIRAGYAPEVHPSAEA
jgi:hypothetical protein